MIFGEKNLFALESMASQFYLSKSQRGLGFFVIYINNIMYGIRESDATLLASSFDAVIDRIKKRGTHKLDLVRYVDARSVSEAFIKARYYDFKDEYFRGVHLSDFEAEIYEKNIMWVPDGDEAFDDGSHILQFDVDEKVRLISFKNKEKIDNTLECVDELWINQEIYYRTIELWASSFEEKWKNSIIL